MRVKPLHVFTACCYNGATQPIQTWMSSCEILGLDYGYYGLSEGWSSTKRIKIDLALEHLRGIEGQYEYVLYADGADSFLLADEREILMTYRILQGEDDKIFLSGNHECWPDPKLADLFPIHVGRWRFPSPGCWMAPLELALETLSRLQHTTHNNDTPAWQDFCLENPDEWLVDHQCQLFWNLSGVYPKGGELDWFGSRVLNPEAGVGAKGTPVRPGVLHWSGRLPGMEKVFQEWKRRKGI